MKKTVATLILTLMFNLTFSQNDQAYKLFDGASEMNPTSRKVNPNAPPETAQFNFLIGDWDCNMKFLIAKDKYKTTKTKWYAYYTLDGYAIQDDAIGPGFRGTTYRTYNPRKKKWIMKWIPANQGNPWDIEAEFVNGEIHATTEGQDQFGKFMDKIFFYDIKPKSFSWRQERSYDQGKTWTLWAEIKAKRKVK